MNTPALVVTQKTIVMNMALLKFLGFENKRGEAWIHPSKKPLLPIGNKVDIKEARFHESLDWLKPVMDKILIHPLANVVAISALKAGDKIHYDVEFIIAEDTENIKLGDHDNLPHILFIACYRFIKQYAENITT